MQLVNKTKTFVNLNLKQPHKKYKKNNVILINNYY